MASFKLPPICAPRWQVRGTEWRRPSCPMQFRTEGAHAASTKLPRGGVAFA